MPAASPRTRLPAGWCRIDFHLPPVPETGHSAVKEHPSHPQNSMGRRVSGSDGRPEVMPGRRRFRYPFETRMPPVRLPELHWDSLQGPVLRKAGMQDLASQPYPSRQLRPLRHRFRFQTAIRTRFRSEQELAPQILCRLVRCSLPVCLSFGPYPAGSKGDR